MSFHCLLAFAEYRMQSVPLYLENVERNCWLITIALT